MHYSLLFIFLVFFKLGSINFGGVAAALVLFHKEFVARLQWVDEKTFIDIVSLCQGLPGPVSSQVAITLGIQQRGIWGGITALLGFILPSAILLIVAAYGVKFFISPSHEIWLHGLKLAVVPVVAQAIWILGQRVGIDQRRITIAVAAAILSIFITGFLSQLAAIFFGAIAGKLFLESTLSQKKEVIHFPSHFISSKNAVIAWLLFLFFLFAPTILNFYLHSEILLLFDRFFRTGSLVFGGGHIVLPLLQSQFVNTGWVDNNVFLAGYGLVQALPGPLFSFAAFLGSVLNSPLQGWQGGIFALISIFLPSMLILLGVLPIWEKWRHRQEFQATLAGVSAAALGLLIAAFYNPVWINAMTGPQDFAVVLMAFILLELWQWPQWLIVWLTVITTVLLKIL